MSDYDDWDGEIGGSSADSVHAAHKPIAEQMAGCLTKEQKAFLISSVRAQVDIDRAAPPAPDTARAEADLLDRKIIERG